MYPLMSFVLHKAQITSTVLYLFIHLLIHSFASLSATLWTLCSIVISTFTLTWDHLLSFTLHYSSAVHCLSDTMSHFHSWVNIKGNVTWKCGKCVRYKNILFIFSFGFSLRTMEANQHRGKEEVRQRVSSGLPVHLGQHEQARGSTSHQWCCPRQGATSYTNMTWYVCMMFVKYFEIASV